MNMLKNTLYEKIHYQRINLTVFIVTQTSKENFKQRLQTQQTTGAAVLHLGSFSAPVVNVVWTGKRCVICFGELSSLVLSKER